MCGCERHRERTAACTCNCPEHNGVRKANVPGQFRQEPLSVRVTSAHEEPTWVDVPRLSSQYPDQVPGRTAYRVDLQAVITSPEEFERWRALLGQIVDIKETG